MVGGSSSEDRSRGFDCTMAIVIALRSLARLTLLAGVVMGPLLACSSKDPVTEPAGPPDVDPTCAPAKQLGAQCVGVPDAPLCDADVCTPEGVECTSTIEVDTVDELVAALDSASPGTCVALLPGSYRVPVIVPAGVNVVGKGAGYVEVDSVEFTGGVSVMSGVTVTGGVIVAEGVQDVRIESVLITGAPGIGLELKPGAAAKLFRCEIIGSVGDGVFAESAYLSMDQTLVSQSGGAGIWSQCQVGCGCVGTLDLTVSRVELSTGMGVTMIGSKGSWDEVEVLDTAAGLGGSSGGLGITACGDLKAKRLQVRDDTLSALAYGLLIDGGNADIGGNVATEGFVVQGTMGGVWVMNLDETKLQQVRLAYGLIQSNRGVGIGLSGETKGYVIDWTIVKGTQLANMMTPDGPADVGDGILWHEGAFASFSNLTLDGNARSSVLIDGEVAAGSAFANVTLQGGDEGKGIVQQSFTGGVMPAVPSGVPFTQQATQLHSVPPPPTAPVAK